MSEKAYSTGVRSDFPDAEIPDAAMFTIDRDTAYKIAAAAATVRDNNWHLVEWFDYRVQWCDVRKAEDAKETASDNSYSVDATRLVVFGQEFCFAGYLKHTDIEVRTDRLSIADLTRELAVGPPADPSANDKIPAGSEGKLMTLDGIEIVATLDVIPGHARLNGATRNADGSLEIHYAGDTEAFWDDQKIEQNALGELLFVDDSGTAYPASQVIVVPEGFDPDDDEEEDADTNA